MTKKLDLSMVTLLCVETRDPSLGEWAIEKCTTLANFSRVVLITNLVKIRTKKVGTEYFQSPHLRSVKEYSQFMMGNLSQYVSGTHVLVIQWDSFITNPDLWDKQFLEYDYIGAVWPHHPLTSVGNGGFSLRSVRLLKALSNPQIKIGHPEDYYICAENKDLLESKFGIQFAPVPIADQFAVERVAWHPAFGFHGFFNFANALNENQLVQVLNLIPRRMLGGLDTYDLLYLAEAKKMNQVSKLICNKLSFQWKFRAKYLGAKLRNFFRDIGYIIRFF